MIYLTMKSLPEVLRDSTGLTLCKLWFMALDGFDTLNLSNYTDGTFDKVLESIKLEKVGAYKFIGGYEVIQLGDSYFIGDGTGAVIYDPFNGTSKDLKWYQMGKSPITAKYRRITK